MVSFKVFFRKAVDKEILLFLSAVIAVIVANSSFSDHYYSLMLKNLGFKYGNTVISLTLSHWINDFLMALFFLVVGIEIKREMASGGNLATWKQRSLPLAAALGGLILPSLIYLAINYKNSAGINGWAIPSATDIAFTLGALSVFGSRIPVSLKIFVTALAIIDDIAAILIIAMFYSDGIKIIYLLCALVIIIILAFCHRGNIKKIYIYCLLGLLLWLFMLLSGIHATIAGVILGFMLPSREDNNISHKFEKFLLNPVSYIILPLFAFANSGVTFNNSNIDFFHPVTIGIVAGLFFGKQIGIVLTTKLAIICKVAKMPEGVSCWQLYGAATLCGIGFTMSLFISLLAFDIDNQHLLNQAKIGIFVGSIISLIFGSIILKFSKRID